LNEPATNTWLAAGLTNSNTTFGGRGSAFTVTGFATSGAAVSTFTVLAFTPIAVAGWTFAAAFFDFFMLFITDTNRTTCLLICSNIYIISIAPRLAQSITRALLPRHPQILRDPLKFASYGPVTPLRLVGF
jgi:fucose 4-O-acetylase-like acetyltransferase